MKRVVCAAACVLLLASAPTGAKAVAPEKWFEIKSPHFTVWSNADDRNTRKLVWQLEQIRSALTELWPWAKVDLPKPLLVLAPKNEQSMKQLAPRYWEVKDGVRPVSVWVSGADQHYLVKQPAASIMPLLARAISLEPGNPWHRLTAARVLWRLGSLDEARKAAEAALAVADDDNERQAAQELLTRIPRG